MSNESPVSSKEFFARFCEERTRESLREFLKNHTGEQSDCDFKGIWPDLSQAAKHILAIANSGGGCLIIGIEEKEDKTFDFTGLNLLQDKADFNNGTHKFLPTRLHNSVSLEDFSFEASEYPKIIGKKFQVVFVISNPAELPFVSADEGKAIQRNRIYVRRQGMTVEANYDELQSLFDKRLAIGTSVRPISEHLDELKQLQLDLQRWKASTPLALQVSFSWGVERYDQFLERMILVKQYKIQAMLNT